MVNNKCIYATSLPKNDKNVRMSLIPSIVSFLRFDNNDVITKSVIIASFLHGGNNEFYPDESSHYYVIVVFGGIGETCAYSWICNFYSTYKPIYGVFEREFYTKLGVNFLANGIETFYKLIEREVKTGLESQLKEGSNVRR